MKKKAMRVIGERLREARKKAGLSREDLAWRCSTTGQTIRRIEIGAVETSVVRVAAICEVLGIDHGDIVRGVL